MQNQFSRPSNVFEGSFELTIREVPVNSGNCIQETARLSELLL